MSEDPNQAKLAIAKALKDEGNQLFKEEKFSKAKVKYATAIAYTKALSGRSMKGSDPMAQLAASSRKEAALDAQLDEEVNNLDAVLKTNLATCLIKLNKPEDALSYARQAMDHNPSHWKAQLRTAEAMLGLRDYDGSIRVLDEISAKTEVLAENGAAANIKRLRDRALKGVKEENQKQKKAFSNIFERLRREDATAVAPTASKEAAGEAEGST